MPTEITEPVPFSESAGPGMPRDVNWGILGASRIAAKFASAMRSVEGATITAIAARAPEAAATFAREHGIPTSCGAYARLLERDDIDVVYIATPNSTHTALAKTALGAGKHVLCEKPLASNGEDAAHVFQLAAARKLVLAEGFMYRHHSQTRQILTTAASGEIGEVRLVCACYSFPLKNDRDIRLQPDLQGGALWDVGVYPVNFARALLGEPLRAFGMANWGNTGVDRDFSGILDFGEGRTAIFDCSFDLPLRRWIEIVGTEGSIYAEDAFMPATGRFHISGRERSREITIEFQNAYAQQIREITDTIRRGTSDPKTADDSVGNARTVAGLYEAAATGSWVELPRGT